MVPEQLVLTNGLDEGSWRSRVAALRERGAITPEAIVVVPAFDMYASTAAGVGARVVEVPLGPEFAFPVERILAAIGPHTRLLYLTSPNNPTGLSIPRGDIVRVARAAPHVRVLVDEAYADFAGVTLIGDPDIATLPNVFIGRTFAKAYGLAGVRAGGGHRRHENASAAQAHRAAVQPQCLRRRWRSPPVWPTRTTTSGISARCGRRRPCSMRRSRQAGVQFLAERREFRAGSFRRPRVAPSSTVWRRAACTSATNRAILRARVASASRRA